MIELQQLLGRAACGGLALIADAPPLQVPSHLEQELLLATGAHRIAGLLCAALDQGSLLASTSCREAAGDAHLAGLHTSLVCEAAAVHCVDVLRIARVECRVLKGVAMAHLDYPDPAMRVFGDADVLVPRAQLADALAALHSGGYARDHPPVREWWERRYGKAVELHDTDDTELDLHLTLTGGFFGLAIDDRDLFREPGQQVPLVHGSVAGRVAALPAGMRLLHAAYHVILGGRSGLRARRDVVQLASTQPASLLAAQAWAARWQGEAVLAAALLESWSALGLAAGHPATEWARRHRPTAHDTACLASYAHDGEGWAAEGRGAVTALRRHHRLLYAAGLAVPSRASLRSRERTWPQHARRMLQGGRP